MAVLYIDGVNGPLEAGELTAVPGTFADVAAVQTYLETLVGELIASPFFKAAS